MIDTNNYTNKIVSMLEEKGYTKDMVIGFLEGTLNGLKYLENKKISQYLQNTVKDLQTKQGRPVHNEP